MRVQNYMSKYDITQLTHLHVEQIVMQHGAVALLGWLPLHQQAGGRYRQHLQVSRRAWHVNLWLGGHFQQVRALPTALWIVCHYSEVVHAIWSQAWDIYVSQSGPCRIHHSLPAAVNRISCAIKRERIQNTNSMTS